MAWKKQAKEEPEERPSLQATTVAVVEEATERLESLDEPFLTRDEKQARERVAALQAGEAEMVERGFVRRREESASEIRSAIDALEVRRAAAPPAPLPEAKVEAVAEPTPPPTLPEHREAVPPVASTPSVPEEVATAVARALGRSPDSLTVVYATERSHVVSAKVGSEESIFTVRAGEARPLEAAREIADRLEPKAPPPAPPAPAKATADSAKPTPPSEPETTRKLPSLPFGKKAKPVDDAKPEPAGEKKSRFPSLSFKRDAKAETPSDDPVVPAEKKSRLPKLPFGKRKEKSDEE